MSSKGLKYYDRDRGEYVPYILGKYEWIFNDTASQLPPGLKLFVYTPLKNPSSHIRLLSITSSATDSNITCTINEYPLASSPPFVAISYSWGPVTDCQPLVINNTFCLSIRGNARGALWQMSLHKPSSSGYYWIDSICINQSSNSEKSSQVRMMSEIYAKAELVAACIGTADKDVALLFHGPGGPGTPPEPFPGVKSGEVQIPALLSFSERAYWTRLWIVQELLLARSVKIFCGEFIADVDELLKREDIAWRLSYRNTFAKKIVGSHAREREKSLLDAIVEYDNAQCAERRDRVYAMLSIVEAGGQGMFREVDVDYDKTLMQVARDFCLALPETVHWGHWMYGRKLLVKEFGLTLEDQNVMAFYDERQRRKSGDARAGEQGEGGQGARGGGEKEWMDTILSSSIALPAPSASSLPVPRHRFVLTSIASVARIERVLRISPSSHSFPNTITIESAIDEWDTHFPLAISTTHAGGLLRPRIVGRPQTYWPGRTDNEYNIKGRDNLVDGFLAPLSPELVNGGGVQEGDFIVSIGDRSSSGTIFDTYNHQHLVYYLIVRPNLERPGAYDIISNAYGDATDGVDMGNLPTDTYAIVARLNSRWQTQRHEYAVLDREDILALTVPDALDVRMLDLPVIGGGSFVWLSTEPVHEAMLWGKPVIDPGEVTKV